MATANGRNVPRAGISALNPFGTTTAHGASELPTNLASGAVVTALELSVWEPAPVAIPIPLSEASTLATSTTMPCVMVAISIGKPSVI